MLSEAADVTITYIGKEAGFRNQFFWADELLFDAGPPVLQGPGSLAVSTQARLNPAGAAGFVVPFSFRINVGGSGASANRFVPNGAVNLRDSQPNIAFFFGDAPGSPVLADPAPAVDLATSGSRVTLLLDDGCGYVGGGPGGCDDDHDDMLVVLTVAAVPTPGSFALVAAGLLMGASIVVRRRSMLA